MTINNRQFYSSIRETKEFEKEEYDRLAKKIDAQRVREITNRWSDYLEPNLERTLKSKQNIDDYRLNPYAATTIAGILELNNTEQIAEYIFGTKLYMSLETAFGKSVEDIILPIYPITDIEGAWGEHPEKLSEMNADSRGEDLVWQKIDKYCVVDDTAYLLNVNSGPRALNESETDSMKSNILEYSTDWLEGTQKHHPDVGNLEFVIGLSYGTDETTNNKEMRVLLKLIEEGFIEKSRENDPGVVLHPENQNISVGTQVGIDFWSFVANPNQPQNAEYAFLEVLLGLIKAADDTAEVLNKKVTENITNLERSLDDLDMPDSTYPQWIESEFGDDELARLVQTLTLYYDEGF